MNDLISMTCQKCGGKLDILPEIEQVKCLHCGTEYYVKQYAGTIGLKPIIDKLGSIDRGVDKTALELSLRRIKEEISLLNAQSENTSYFIGSIGLPIISFSFGLYFILEGLLTSSYSHSIIGVLLLFPIIIAYKAIKIVNEKKKLIAKNLAQKNSEHEAVYEQIYPNSINSQNKG